MDRKTAIHSLLNVIAFELLETIRKMEPSFPDRWVPAAQIKRKLDLNLVPYPKEGEQRGKKGWLFASLARKLQDDGLLEYSKPRNRAFYRSKFSNQ